MSDLARIKNVANELWDIADKARSNFGEEGYQALEKAANEVANAWRICKIGLDEKLNNAYRTPVNNSRKSIKSSLDDRLIPYLEEFEEGYANALASTDEMGPEVRLDTFYEIFKSDYNLSDDDINKLKDSVEGIWKESKEI